MLPDSGGEKKVLSPNVLNRFDAKGLNCWQIEEIGNPLFVTLKDSSSKNTRAFPFKSSPECGMGT